MRSLAVLMFNPTSASLDYFNSVQSILSTKAPFAYFYALDDKINDLTYATGTLGYINPTISIADESFELTLGGISTSTQDTAKGYIEIGLWVMFSLFIFNVFKSLF